MAGSRRSRRSQRRSAEQRQDSPIVNCCNRLNGYIFPASCYCGASCIAMAEDPVQIQEERAMVWALLSSFLFWLGSILLTLSIFDEVETTLFSFLGYAFLALHVLPELVVDCVSPHRPFAHSRYGKLHGMNRSFGGDLVQLNIAQSLIFLSAVCTQALAFGSTTIFSSFLDDSAGELSIAAAMVFLISAAMSLVARGCCKLRFRRWSEGIDHLATRLYTASTCSLFFASMVLLEDGSNELGLKFQNVTWLLWAIVGVMLVIADALRFVEESSIDNVDGSPLHDEDDGSWHAAKMRLDTATEATPRKAHTSDTVVESASVEDNDGNETDGCTTDDNYTTDASSPTKAENDTMWTGTMEDLEEPNTPQRRRYPYLPHGLDDASTQGSSVGPPTFGPPSMIRFKTAATAPKTKSKSKRQQQRSGVDITRHFS